jgi:hypothetical protein
VRAECNGTTTIDKRGALLIVIIDLIQMLVMLGLMALATYFVNLSDQELTENAVSASDFTV